MARLQSVHHRTWRGFVVSVPFSFPVRIEAPRDSTLPKRLGEAGYDLVFRGQLTRIGNAAPKHDREARTQPLTVSYGFHMVDVYELALDKAQTKLSLHAPAAQQYPMPEKISLSEFGR